MLKTSFSVFLKRGRRRVMCLSKASHSPHQTTINLSTPNNEERKHPIACPADVFCWGANSA